MRIELVGKFYDNHSLSIVNRNLAINLKDKVELSILPLDEFDSASKVDTDEVEIIKSLATIEEAEHSDIQVRHSYPTIFAWPKAKDTRLVYIQPWEFMAIPSEWQYKFDTFADAVITPSDWTRNVYITSGINPDKVFAIPNGYNPSIYNTQDSEKTSGIKQFLYVGCHQYRKGIDILLQAWVNSTKRSDRVRLVIKDTPQIYGQSNLQADILKIQYNTKCGEVVYLDTQYSSEEMAALYKRSDYIVHPYRGEGFGMHILEAEQCGAIPIVTSGGPTDEFAGGIKIQATRKVVNMYDIFALKPGDSMSLMGQHKWVLEPSTDHLSAILKELLNGAKPPVTNKKGNTWTDVADAYVDTFKQVLERDSIVRR
jgi:glycosyltransferase involved in cell wall biosynthesis